jgi:hypothetical protein
LPVDHHVTRDADPRPVMVRYPNGVQEAGIVIDEHTVETGPSRLSRKIGPKRARAG